jgi:putative DNA primase/helicase
MTLNVRTRNITDLFNFELPFEFNKDADMSNAIKFFSMIMKNDKEIIEYLQINLGYCITGEINQRCIYIFWGSGANGKSTMCDLLYSIMSKFCVAVSKKVFIMNDRGSSHSEHLMPLVNSRIAIFSETKKGDSLNEELIKSLTGGDKISARAIYGKQFTFKPCSKYMILTNSKPDMDINSKAMMDRVRYIPFGAVFSEKPKKDEYLRDHKFIEELGTVYLEEVFNWLCIGAHKYYNLMDKGKLIPIPKQLEDAKNNYLSELDSASSFIENMCEKGDKYRISRSELYDRYVLWFKKDGVGNMVKNSGFYKRLKQIGYKEVKSSGTRNIIGLQMITENEDNKDVDLNASPANNTV